MELLLQNSKIYVQDSLYNKDPESSALGKRIVENSIELIDELGFEMFTFKKLGKKIKSNESSIYRYFENKHKLLLYLSSWYWAWTEYRMVMATYSIKDPIEKLKKAIEITTAEIEVDSQFTHINEATLHRIIVNENSKSFLTKEVDQENKDGYFLVYKRLIGRYIDMIKEVNKDYLYPESLASTIVEASLHQSFLKDHFPTITSCNSTTPVKNFMVNLVFNTLDINHYGSK